jgi:hypothetical protein
VLAIAGCVVVQCLILFWILLAKVQIYFVLVQERMLRQVYEQTNESHPSADEQRTTKSESIPDVTINAPASVPTPTTAATETQLSPQAQSFELPDAGTASPRPATPAEVPVWQTKALTARKAGGKRSYAVKQVDSLAPAIPPGFGPLKPVSETVNKSAVIPSEGAVQLSANAVPFSPDYTPGVSEAEALYATWPTRSTVRPPPGLPSSPKYNQNNQPKTVFEHVASSFSLEESMGHTKAAGTNRRARRSVIKKVQSVEDQGTFYKKAEMSGY